MSVAIALLPDLAALAQDGFTLLASPLPAADITALQAATASSRPEANLRRATDHLPLARALATGPLLNLARAVLGPAARPVRSILFDKTPEQNWLVPWHQDLTIAVACRHDMEGFGPWSVKGGVPHVQPPVAILESMITLRLHLDDTPATNGALKVLPTSHALGILSSSAIPALRTQLSEHTCEAAAGDLLLMRPLLLHASAKSQSPTRRRVLHIEHASASLPAPLQWAESLTA